MKKRIFALLIATTLVLSLFSGCAKKSAPKKENPVAEDKLTTGELGVIKDEKFGNVYIDLTSDELNALGFKFGDSVDISFDNGKKYTDIPYYSGYYVPFNEMLICGDTDYPHVVIARNYGDSTWDEFELSDASKVTVTQNEAGKYLEVEDSHVHKNSSGKYSDNRDDYESDIIFANFREIKGGNLRKEYFYRSVSPCDNHHNRAYFANKLAEEYKINFVINMSDDEEEYSALVESPDFTSEYYNNLYKSGNVLLLGLDTKYRSDEYCQSLSNALFEMTKHDGPILIHCLEGKDRTGFASALLLALADADSQEIIDDYMLSFYNYSGITKENDPAKYDALIGVCNDFFYFLCDVDMGTDVKTLDIKAGAENYLKKGGLTDEQIKEIEDYISK